MVASFLPSKYTPFTSSKLPSSFFWIEGWNWRTEGSYYLSHAVPDNGTGVAVGEAVYGPIENTKLEQTCDIAGADGTPVNTGKWAGAIRTLEELLGRPLQWTICLLHSNELLLHHIFPTLDGTTKSPDAFSGPSGAKLGGLVSEWDIVNFKKLATPVFWMNCSIIQVRLWRILVQTSTMHTRYAWQ